MKIYNPTKINFGAGCLKNLQKSLESKKICIITSPGHGSRNWLRSITSEHIYSSISPNPTVEEIKKLALWLKNLDDLELILAIGGGSVIDAAKAASLLMQGSPNDFDDLILSEKVSLFTRKVQLIAVPTTSGTGSEVTPYSTVWDNKNQKKLSVSNESIFPDECFVDPEITLSLPANQTIFTALDTLSHCLESVWNVNANPYTMSLAKLGIRAVLTDLPKALKDPNNIAFRTGLAWASLMGGLCIAQTKTALGHSISYPLTLKFNLPHGLAASMLLPELLAYNLKKEKGSSLRNFFKDHWLEGSEKLIQDLEELQKEVGLKSFLPNEMNLLTTLNLKSQMISPARAANNIAPVDDLTLETLLNGFFKRLHG